MPIHEYQCTQCGKQFEELVFDKSILPPCPNCSAKQTKKLLSCACLHMPGSSRVGQTVTFPSSNRRNCGGCSGGNCSTCK